MELYCLDLEGILIPEIWVRVAKRFKVNDLKLTTRDIPNYDQLMRYRLKILRREKIRLADIQRVIQGMSPLPGAQGFLKKLQVAGPVVILSDTYYEFSGSLMKQLDHPTLLCNWLKIDRAGYISGYVLRQRDGKRKAVQSLKRLGFRIKAVGDSFNDLTMLKAAHQGVLFNPPAAIARAHRNFPVAKNYNTLLKHLLGTKKKK